MNAVITGAGMYVPEKTLTNFDLEKMVDTSNEWIIERSGIEVRHITAQDEYCSDMASKAAIAAIENAKLTPTDIDMILVTTISPDMMTPCAACIVQKNIGAANAVAMDLNAACTGFIYGLATGESFIKSNGYKHVLVIGSETLSKVTDYKDRGTCVLFGDGAGAVVLSATDEDYGIRSRVLGADGTKGDVLTLLNLKSTEEELEKRISKNPATIYMDGSEVFKFAVRTMVSATLQALEQANITTDDLDLLIPHQANVRILDGAAKRLKLSPDRVMNNIKDYANMSSASVPVALCAALQQNRLKDGDNIVMCGFGGGLTWAAVAMKWKEIK